jgi:leucyl/phenylalanyl-tRNA---protein transferase
MDLTMRLRPRLGDFGALFSEGVETDEEFRAREKRRQTRVEAFRDTAASRAKRSLKALLHLLEPRRLAHLPSTLDLMMREKLVRPCQLPDPRAGLSCAEGLAGLATDLAPETMLQAYASGLSPSACLGPVAWHSRDTRHVALPTDVARQVRAHPRPGQPEWAVTFDRDPEAILAASGRLGKSGTLMPQRLLQAFGVLYDSGFAHTFEVRDELGRVVGGGFGVAVGRVFIVEGAFEVFAGAGRVGLVALMGRLRDWNFALVERAPGAAWLGGDAFFTMSRDDYLENVKLHLSGDVLNGWRDENGAAPPIPRAGWRQTAPRAA